MQQYLLRYGEIGTKSPNVRKNFEDILIQNIERMFLKEDREVFIERERGRIFAFIKEESAYLFSRIFGLVSYSLVKEIPSDIESIRKKSREIVDDFKGSFAVRARRTGNHDFSSQEAAAEAGEAILEKKPDLEVDLDNPDHELHLEIRDKLTYLFTDINDAPGGLPLSSQGKVAAYIEDVNDFVATWLIMKRGARPYVFYPPESGWLEKLEKWDPNLKKLGEGNFDDFLSLDLPEEIDAIILGFTLEDYKKIEHDLPVFNPLIGFTKERIKKTLDRISILSNQELNF